MEKECSGGISHLNTEPKGEGGKVVTRNGRAQMTMPGWHEPKRSRTKNSSKPSGWGGSDWLAPESAPAQTEAEPEAKAESPDKLEPDIVGEPAQGMVWEDQEDTGLGWLGPENIDQAVQDVGWGTAKPSSQNQLAVACVTTDFAMQNVLIQMGLKVLSVDGMVIRRARCYILKCEACFKTTTDLMREFCPSCGNHTLYKVSVQSTANGVSHYEMRSRKNSKRGTRFSIPLPKGGRHNNDIVLREDQLKPPKAPKAIDWCDPDAGWEMQGKRGAANKSYGMGRRNPNERKGKVRGKKR